MADQYVLVAILGAVALFIPVSMLMFSRLVRPQGDENEVQKIPYESAEVPFGKKMEVMHEYLHYFVAFLAFEIISVIVIIWSTFQKAALSASSAYVFYLLIFGLVFEVFLLAISKKVE